MTKICYPGKCEFLEFLAPSEGCYRVGGMKCIKYNKIVIKYGLCLDETEKREESRLENKTE